MNNTFLYAKEIILLLLLLVFVLVPYHLPFSKEIIYFCVAASSLCFIFQKNKYGILSQREMIIPIAMFTYGLSFFIWVIIFGDFSGDYTPHLRKARIMVLLALAMPLFMTYAPFKLPVRKIIFTATTLLTLSIFVLSIYQCLFLNQSRATFYLGLGATEAAYIISIISITAVSFCPKKHRNITVFVLFLLAYSPILLTGTRSAILAFPFLYLLVIILFKPKKQTVQLLLGVIVSCFVIGIAAYFMYDDQLRQRIDASISDVKLYLEQKSSKTSLGARFAMFEVGIDVGSTSLFGQSIEARVEKTQEIVSEDPFYESVLPFLHRSHLHNEVVENFSLRGVWGVALLLFLYVSIFYIAIKQRNSLLFTVGATTVIYGMADVVLNGELTYIFYLAIFLGLFSHYSNPNLENKDMPIIDK